MRDIPEDLASRLAEGVTTLAHVWLFTRADAQRFAFTDHDEPLAFDDLTCEPAAGLTLGAIEKSLGLAVDTASVTGALNSAAITDEDLVRGLWDGARVDIYCVDWGEPASRVHLFAGRLGEVQRGVSAFEAEIRGLQASLNIAVGRVFSRYCDADLGDARCGKNIDDAAFRAAGEVTEALSSSAFRATGLETYADDWFARGKLVWSDGGVSEVAAQRFEDGTSTIELLDKAGAVLIVGATFAIYAGCDKRFETCGAKFGNTTNFRGFPHMPGNDAIQARPMAGDQLDGSSRFK